jgi:response regulator RpfG family c-di-GMP phosphodiesterase
MLIQILTAHVQCVTAILGVANPSDTYAVYDAQKWRRAVDQQWVHSGLPNALRRLTSDLVAQAKQRVLLEETMQFQKQLRRITINQQYAWRHLTVLCLELMLNWYRRVLLEMRRSRDDFEAAQEQFQMARVEFTSTLDIWSGKEQQRDRDYDKKLAQYCATLQKFGTQHVLKTLEETSKSSSEMV